MITSRSRYQAPRQDDALRRSGVTSQHSILPFPSYLNNTHLTKHPSLAEEQDGSNKTSETCRT